MERDMDGSVLEKSVDISAGNGYEAVNWYFKASGFHILTTFRRMSLIQ